MYNSFSFTVKLVLRELVLMDSVDQWRGQCILLILPWTVLRVTITPTLHRKLIHIVKDESSLSFYFLMIFGSVNVYMYYYTDRALIRVFPFFPSRYRKVAGDKCIHGNQSFYLPISVTCPVLPPADMTIMTSNYHVRANKEITFTLEQRNVSIGQSNVCHLYPSLSSLRAVN